MTTSHQGDGGRPPWQEGSHSGSGDAFLAGGSIHITQPPLAPPPSRASTGKAIAISAGFAATMILGAVLGAQFGWGPADKDGKDGSAAQGSRDTQGVSPQIGTGLSVGDDTSVQSTVSGAEPTGASGTDTVRYRGPVRLAALDLDANPPTVQGSDLALYSSGFMVVYPQLTAQGATAFGSSGDMVSSTPALAPYAPSGTPGRKVCGDLLRTQAVAMLPVEEGSRLCVKTANGRIAFLAAGRFTNGAFEGTALVWDAID